MPLYQRIDFLRNADGCIHIQMKMLRYNVFSCQEIYHGRLHFRQTVCAQPAKKLNKEMKHRSLTEPVFAEILFCTGGNQLGTCIMNFRECVPVDQCNWRECCLNC